MEWLGKELRIKTKTQYFVQMGADGKAFGFYRKRYCTEGLFEEVWQHKNKKWHYVPLTIIWMQISGECSLVQVSSERFKQLAPEACGL